MTRGEIWWVDFGVPQASEAGYRHPAIVVQNDNYNASRIYTTVVVPLSSNLTLAEHKDNLFLSKNKTKLPSPADFNIYKADKKDLSNIKALPKSLDEAISLAKNSDFITPIQKYH